MADDFSSLFGNKKNNPNSNPNSNSNVKKSNQNKGQPKNKVGTQSSVKIIVLILIIVLVLWVVYKMFRGFSKQRNDSYWIVKGTRQGDSQSLPISAYKFADPDDGQYGTEFTYTVWLYIKDTNFVNSGNKCGNSKFRHIFHKGSDDYYVSGDTVIQPLLQSPGLWLYPTINKLRINLNTYDSPKETCDIGNIPVNKWFHLTIMLIGNSLDVYVNCNLKKRCRLKGVPKLNYGKLFLSSWGGFDGFISKFKYHNYALQPYEVENACAKGPSSAPPTDPGVKPPYLAKDYWMTTGFPNSLVNP